MNFELEQSSFLGIVDPKFAFLSFKVFLVMVGLQCHLDGRQKCVLRLGLEL